MFSANAVDGFNERFQFSRLYSAVSKGDPYDLNERIVSSRCFHVLRRC